MPKPIEEGQIYNCPWCGFLVNGATWGSADICIECFAIWIQIPKEEKVCEYTKDAPQYLVEKLASISGLKRLNRDIQGIS